MSRQSATQPADEPGARMGRPFGGNVVRLLLLFEASTFVAAAAVHFGVLLEGYRTAGPGPPRR